MTTADARLSANRPSANRLAAYSAAANSAAASKLAGSKLAIEQLGSHEYTVDPEAAGDLLATPEGREVLSFIVSCALPEEGTLQRRESSPGFFAGCMIRRFESYNAHHGGSST